MSYRAGRSRRDKGNAKTPRTPRSGSTRGPDLAPFEVLAFSRTPPVCGRGFERGDLASANGRRWRLAARLLQSRPVASLVRAARSLGVALAERDHGALVVRGRRGLGEGILEPAGAA